MESTQKREIKGRKRKILFFNPFGLKTNATFTLTPSQRVTHYCEIQDLSMMKTVFMYSSGKQSSSSRFSRNSEAKAY